LLELQPTPAHNELFAKGAPLSNSELWLETGFRTAHFNRRRDLTGKNHRLGAGVIPSY
jgi:hypothetical protein